jgi:hypothetical protein
VVETRVVTLFDRGVEGVAVDMSDVQPGRVFEEKRARRAAISASRRIAGILPQTIAAEAKPRRVHQVSP